MKLSDYFAMMMIGPFFFIIASSVTVFIVGRLQEFVAKMALYDPVSHFLIFWIKLVPYAVIWILFTIIYIVMPNTKVRFIPAVVGGVIAGSIYQIFQWAYIYFQIGVSRYGAIYGSFAALPLFLIWMQLSWLTVLAGAEISYACQHLTRFEFCSRFKKLSHHLKTLLCLWIVHQAVHRFIANLEPLSKIEIHQELEVPFPIIDELTDELCACGLLTELKAKKERKFQIARSPRHLRIQDVIDAVEGFARAETFNVPSKVFIHMKETLKKFHSSIVESPDNRKFVEILPYEGKLDE
jgi:membrane protein